MIESLLETQELKFLQFLCIPRVLELFIEIDNTTDINLRKLYYMHTGKKHKRNYPLVWSDVIVMKYSTALF